MPTATTASRSSRLAGGSALFALLVVLPQIALGQWGDQVERVSEALIWGPFHDVHIASGHAYCAMGYGLGVFDVSDSSQIQWQSYFGVPGKTEGLALDGSTAYLASGSAGLDLVDVTDPVSPVFISSLPLPGYAYEAVKGGDFLYVADGPAGLKVVDVSDPLNPHVAATLALGGGALDLYLEDTTLYIAAEGAGLKVVDAAVPTSPQVIGMYNTSGVAQGVTKSGNLVYVADGAGGVAIVNVSNPAQPTLTGQWPTSTGIVHEVKVSGAYAYAANDAQGVAALNVSNPALPYLAGSYYSHGQAWSLEVSGGALYLANDVHGLQSLSLAMPTTPALLDSFSYPGEVLSVWVGGNYAYVSRGYGESISILDVSDPSQLLPVSEARFREPVVEQVVQGNTCYSAQLTGGVAFNDISNPLNPVYLGRENTPGQAHDIIPQLPIIFVADDWDGLVFLSSSPDSAWQLPTSGFAMSLLQRNDTLYVSQWNAGVALVDVSPPTQPQMLAQYDTPGNAHHCAVFGEYIYVADDLAGLTILRSGAVVGQYDPGGDVWDVKVVGTRAYLAAGTAGLVVLDITNPSAPVYAGSYRTPGIAQRLFLSGDDIYVADQYSLGVYRYTGSGVVPEPPALPSGFGVSVHPNPFNASAVASYELRVPSDVKLTVWDTAGRLVGTLVNERQAAGTHQVAFEGSGLAAGVYLFKLEAGAEVEVKKAVLLK